MSSYVKGRYLPKTQKINEIAKYLNVSPSYLIGAESEFREYSSSTALDTLNQTISKLDLERQLEVKNTLILIYKNIKDFSSLDLKQLFFAIDIIKSRKE